MPNMMNALYNIRLLDDLAKKKTIIHRIHPLIKLLTTVAYLTVVVSFGRYEIASLLPYIFYPVIVFTLAELPVGPILKRLMFIEPFILGIGILNPVFDNQTVVIGEMVVSRGWMTFLAIFIKCDLTITASILLIATTGIDQLAAALRMLKVPKIFVLQIVLTYRYITVLIEEVHRMLMAYSMRAPKQKGVQHSVWGSFAGGLMLRTFERAQRIYEAMSLRGFTGEYNTGDIKKIGLYDFLYLAGWCLFFSIAKIYNLPMLIGSVVTGVIK